jgi:hypothetical protein
VTKINSSGDTIVYSTCLGGTQIDAANRIAVNAAGNAFVVGNTFSSDFPVANAFQPTKGSSEDIFVSKLNAAGNALVYSTYLGGSGFDIGFGLALDSADNIFLAGSTDSLDFPTTNDARQPTASSQYGHSDAEFHAKPESNVS